MGFLRILFGPEIPPAASDSGESDENWDECLHNKKLNGVVSKSRIQAIKDVDLKSKAKYDSMDTHIKRLRELRVKIRERKAAKKAAATLRAEVEPV